MPSVGDSLAYETEAFPPMTAIVLWKPHSALLEAHNTHVRQRAFKARSHYADLRERVNDQIWSQYALWPDLDQKIVQAEARLRARQEGAPMTELTDDEIDMRDGSATYGMSYAQRQAHRFLLKKAWKRVRSMLHPDRSQGDAEVFKTLQDAYRAGDLNALTEFTISADKTVMEQIAYWINEEQKPAMEWRILQRMPMFDIVRALARGDKEHAKTLAFQQRMARLRELELEELLMDS